MNQPKHYIDREVRKTTEPDVIDVLRHITGFDTFKHCCGCHSIYYKDKYFCNVKPNEIKNLNKQQTIDYIVAILTKINSINSLEIGYKVFPLEGDE